MKNDLSPPSGLRKIDVHCHMFNKKVASVPFLLEVAAQSGACGNPGS